MWEPRRSPVATLAVGGTGRPVDEPWFFKVNNHNRYPCNIKTLSAPTLSLANVSPSRLSAQSLYLVIPSLTPGFQQPSTTNASPFIVVCNLYTIYFIHESKNTRKKTRQKKYAPTCYLSTDSSTNQSSSSSHRYFFTTVPWGLGSTQYNVCKWTSISGILDRSMSIKYPNRIRSTTRCVTIKRSDVILSSSIINGFSLWITSKYDSPPIPTKKNVQQKTKRQTKNSRNMLHETNVYVTIQT